MIHRCLTSAIQCKHTGYVKITVQDGNFQKDYFFQFLIIVK